MREPPAHDSDSGVIRVLLVEDDPEDVLVIRQILREAGSSRFKLDCAQRVSEALNRLDGEEFEIVLLDLNLPDSRGLDSFRSIHAKKPEVPIVVLSGLEDEETALVALQEGAQDYLVKSFDTGPLLVRSIRYAIERQLLLMELEKKSKEVREVTQQLWQTAKLATMGELSASIAHEINNPLATISLRVESLLADLPEEDPRHKLAEVIDGELERMARLVSNLLQFSRRSPPRISSAGVCEELEGSLDLISHHFRKNRIAVVREFPGNIPPVQVDRQQLRQVFMNLFINACDAMPKGGTLTVRVSAAEYIAVEITDTGMGIAPEDLHKTLEPFFTTKPEGKGTGLGLPICRRIIEEHGGTLQIRSKVNEGTGVLISLPRQSRVNGAALSLEEPPL